MKIRLLILTLLIGTSICHAGGKRIISLAPSLTKSIYYLEAQDQLVGRTSYCFVADKDNKEVVASAVTVNRSEEHTSELQSRPHLVCRLLLEKKKKTSVAATVVGELVV